MTSIVIGLTCFAVGAAAGWLGYRKYGAKAEAIKDKIEGA
jgi:multisubunit Na+/H+ antiporter MnhC subunit